MPWHDNTVRNGNRLLDVRGRKALCRESAQHVVHKGYEDPKVIGALVDSGLQESDRHEPTRCNRWRIGNLRHISPCVSPDHAPGGSIQVVYGKSAVFTGALTSAEAPA